MITAGPHGGYGNAIDIQHSSGVVTRYGHTSKIFVKVGDLVMPGQEIGEIGSTGRSTGPHLHFEVIIDGTQVNPKSLSRALQADAPCPKLTAVA